MTKLAEGIELCLKNLQIKMNIGSKTEDLKKLYIKQKQHLWVISWDWANKIKEFIKSSEFVFALSELLCYSYILGSKKN